MNTDEHRFLIAPRRSIGVHPCSSVANFTGR